MIQDITMAITGWRISSAVQKTENLVPEKQTWENVTQDMELMVKTHGMWQGVIVKTLGKDYAALRRN